MSDFETICPKCQGKGLNKSPEGPQKETVVRSRPYAGLSSFIQPSRDFNFDNVKPVVILAGLILLLVAAGFVSRIIRSRREAAPEIAFFDLPRARNLTVEEARAIFGKPTDFYFPFSNEIKSGVEEGTSGWTKGSYRLWAKYNIRTMRVVYYQLDSTDAASVSSNLKPMLDIVGLTENEPLFSVEPASAAGRPDQYAGLKITPLHK